MTESDLGCGASCRAVFLDDRANACREVLKPRGHVPALVQTCELRTLESHLRSFFIPESKALDTVYGAVRNACRKALVVLGIHRNIT